MAGCRRAVADPETRTASLLTEKKIIAEVERKIQLSPKERAKLPAHTREHLEKYLKEASSP